jgi:hypothetical protein
VDLWAIISEDNLLTFKGIMLCGEAGKIIIIYNIIIFIDCNWIDTRWQWSFNMLNMHGLWRLLI